MPAQETYVVQPRYVTPPHYITPPPHDIVPQASSAPTPSANTSPPPSPWSWRGGGILEGIFGGPTVMAHVFRPFQPNYVPASPQNAPATYTSIDQGDTADYPVDPQYLRQVVPYDGGEKPGTIIIDSRTSSFI